jgi:hypothetical protein
MVGRVVGTEITEMSVKRGDVVERPLNIKNDIKVIAVEKKSLTAGNEVKDGLVFRFEFTTKYGDKSGDLNVRGSIFYMDKPKELEELVANWKKEKKIDDKLMVGILNKALELSYLRAVALAEHCKLPLPMQMPRFQSKPVEKEDKKKK